MRIGDETIGGADLSAWRVAPGFCWVQTRSPRHARRLGQRQDSRLVVQGVAGGYLRTFAFAHSLAWARRLIARYTGNGKATNARFSVCASPGGAPEQGNRVRTAGDSGRGRAAARRESP